MTVPYLSLLPPLSPDEDDDTASDRLLWELADAELRAKGILPPHPTLSLVPPIAE
jgi:hypothetical protein